MLGFLYLSIVSVAITLGARHQFLRLRKGDEPRCGRCEYNLTGNVTGRCPEFGGLLHDVGTKKGTPVLSERARRAVNLFVLVVISVHIAAWLLLALGSMGVHRPL